MATKKLLKLSFGVLSISICSTLLIILLFSFFNVEIIDAKLYAGRPIVNPISPSKIVFAVILAGLISVVSHLTFKGTGRVSRITAVGLIAIFVVIFSLPNLRHYHGLVYCQRLESFREYVASGLVEYFRKNPEAISLPNIFDIVDRIPPSFDLKISGKRDTMLTITVSGIKGKCGQFESVTKDIEINYTDSTPVTP